MTRDPDAWAIYARTTDPDGDALLRSVQLLGLLVGRREGRIAGIYGDVGAPGGPEFGVLLEHASSNRFANVAVLDVHTIGHDLDQVAPLVMCLYDLGVRLHAYMLGGVRDINGIPLDLDQVGREVLGAVEGAVNGASYGRTIDVITSTIGTAAGRHRPT